MPFIQYAITKRKDQEANERKSSGGGSGGATNSYPPNSNIVRWISPDLFGKEQNRKFHKLLNWAQVRYKVVIYYSIGIQLLANLGVLTTILCYMSTDSMHIPAGITETYMKRHFFSILTPCLVTHFLVVEWYCVRNRVNTEQGNMFGIMGLVLLLTASMALDALSLIQSHISLNKVRKTRNLTEMCYELYTHQWTMNNSRVFYASKYFMDEYKCCGAGTPPENLFYHSKSLNITTFNTTLQCFLSPEYCPKTNSSGEHRICLSRLLNETINAYTATYVVLILFCFITLFCMCLFLFHFNSVSTIHDEEKKILQTPSILKQRRKHIENIEGYNPI